MLLSRGGRWALVLALAPIGTAAGASTTIDGCTTIDSPGRYALGSDVSNIHRRLYQRHRERRRPRRRRTHRRRDSFGLCRGRARPLRDGCEQHHGSETPARELVGRDVNDAADLRVTDGRSALFGGGRLRIGGGSDVRVEGVLAKGNPTGIELLASDAVLRDSRAIGNDCPGVGGGNGRRDARVVDVTARENRDGIVFDGPRRRVLFPAPASNLTVTDSTIRNNDHDGVRFANPATVTNASAGGPSPRSPDLQAPTDPDGDGVYEDATGDGNFNVVDVATFPARLGQVPDSEIESFDCNDDDQINIVDVAALLEKT